MLPTIAIQTVPGREILLRYLRGRLPQALIYSDTDRRGPLWNMERIMLAHSRSGVLILQDDVIVPDWFTTEFTRCWMPDRCMTFFMGISEEPLRLWNEGYSYVETQNIWGQANWYPSKFLEEYLPWSAAEATPVCKGVTPPRGVRRYSGDDTSICMYLRHTRQYSVMTLPHLVDHQEVHSTLGHPSTVRGKARVSNVFGEQYLREWDRTKIARMR